jgi:hypothetical protein
MPEFGKAAPVAGGDFNRGGGGGGGAEEQSERNETLHFFSPWMGDYFIS